MKKSLLVLSLTLMSLSSFASMRAGGNVEHALKCGSRNRVMGVQFGLVVTTAALAPQYNVRAITLTKRILSPNAKLEKIALKQDNQNAYIATFETKDVKVTLDKSTFKASMYVGLNEFVCE